MFASTIVLFLALLQGPSPSMAVHTTDPKPQQGMYVHLTDPLRYRIIRPPHHVIRHAK